jgi:hypothetical protein
MGITVDPDEFIRDWLEENWNGGGVGFTPTFSTAPYKTGQVLPMISITEVRSPPDHLNLNSTMHLYYCRHAIDLWHTKKDQLWDMRQEVRRIVYTYQKNPTSTNYPTPGIMSILISDEFPQDNYVIKPYLLSRSIRVTVLHLETNS